MHGSSTRRHQRRRDTEFPAIVFRRLFLVAPLYRGCLCSADPGAKTVLKSCDWSGPASVRKLSGVVEFNKLFHDFNRIAAVILLCNICFLFTTYCDFYANDNRPIYG